MVRIARTASKATPHENVLGIRDVVPDDSDSDLSAPVKQELIKIGSLVKKTTPVKRKNPPVKLSPEEQQRREDQRAARKEALIESRQKVIVGLDFGTTYSGIAYVSSSTERSKKTAKDVEVITKWTGGQNDILEKVPSKIAYASENKFDTDLWGYDVEPGSVSCQWFKLLLESTQKVSDFDDPLLAKAMGGGLLRLPKGKTAQQVTADFLRFLYHHCLRQLKSMMGAVAVSQTPILFQLTLPATWSHTARNATRQAAIDAGFESRRRDEIVLIDEPEAAAIAALTSTIDAFPDNTAFRRGSSVLICDLGGGTSDFVTYKIAKVEPLQLEEACVGEGGKCGGTSIDRAFWEFLSNVFGAKFKDLPIQKTASGSALMKHFEEIKRNFRGAHAESVTYNLSLKMKIKAEESEEIARHYDEDDDRVRFTSEDLEAMFEPTMNRVFQLVHEQIKRTRKAKMPPIRTLVLCGGLGSSPYVKYRFEEFIKEKHSGKIEVITPKRPWSAIARGAAIRALEKPSVLFRRARDHIGIQVHERFDEGRHRQEDYFECPILGPRAQHQMRWSVERGEKIKPNMKKVINAYVGIDKAESGKPVIIYQDFYSCAEDDAPNRLDEETCAKVGRIKMDLTQIVRDELKSLKKANEGSVPDKLDIDVKIELTCGSDKGILEAAGKVGRRQVGATTIEYFSDPVAGN